ncbi:hypothetical protein L21_1977 [Methanoculleus chikugoensis]|uniref:Uncharacterized protein n=1 Tax=Methanoculleus chikugoensis TaxID=118126 RepID=A0A1M4MMF9_9EURY|nr:hypothetical protein [Methanoculleus chikugoensis]MDD4566688.1 hypothetical protein [Methanoculleus chikugoensis]SCL76056.1 hypothetical protein L21_1977 [Methanoculleus chikugoensis]
MRSGILVASLLLMAVIVAPAGAFTTDNLLIAVDEDGSASITINYTLSWIETIAVFFKIADPAQELKSALEGSLGVPVTVTSAESDSAAFSVREFAEIEGADGGRVYSTPGLDFTGAQEVIDSYWFASLVETDLSPGLTVVRFPDGHEETFSDQSAIPPLSHTVE